VSHGTLSHALEALLYRANDRAAFLAGDRARFGLSPADEDAIATIDPEQLVSAARLARAHVFERGHRGVGSLLHVFRRTIDAWTKAHPELDFDELASAFVGSASFDAYRTVGFCGKGISLEEAFFRFAEEREIGSSSVRFREYAFAILCGLAATPDPVFVVPEIVRRAPTGWFVVLPDGPTLMAVLGGRFIEGEITPYIAAVLTSSTVADAAMPSEPERRAVEAELARIGLIAPAAGCV
jgi:hypothetical protein